MVVEDKVRRYVNAPQRRGLRHCPEHAPYVRCVCARARARVRVKECVSASSWSGVCVLEGVPSLLMFSQLRQNVSREPAPPWGLSGWPRGLLSIASTNTPRGPAKTCAKTWLKNN